MRPVFSPQGRAMSAESKAASKACQQQVKQSASQICRSEQQRASWSVSR